MKEVDTVSIYILKEEEILLLFRNKKEIDINKGKYIGVGGHIEEGETPLEAIVREVKEETNLDIVNPPLRALVHFYFDDFIEHMYLYSSTSFSGEMKECNEGTLYWIKKDNIKNINMWEGDKYFLYPILDNKPYFEIEMTYQKDKLISYRYIK